MIIFKKNSVFLYIPIYIFKMYETVMLTNITNIYARVHVFSYLDPEIQKYRSRKAEKKSIE